jgi:alkylation response protein AidB-like acyl-CoA dehydrogenase
MLEAAAPRIEAACALPADVLDALHAAQMFRMLLPRSFGGGELDPASFARVVAAIAEGDASVAWCVGQNSGCSMAAAYMEPASAREVFGDSRAVVAWGFPLGPQCRAVPVEGGYRVSGTWAFASGNRHSTWLGGHCQECDANGTPLSHPDGRVRERTMLFPREQADVREVWEVVGLRGTGSDTYSVKDLFVANRHTVARDQQLTADEVGEAEAERREPGTLYRFSTMNLYAAGFAGVALGIARAALDAFIALATSKTPSGTRLALRDNHVIQARIALSEAKLGSAAGWLERVLDEAWREVAVSPRISFDERIRIRLASTYAIHEAREVVETAYAEAGATAIFQSNPFERRLRDINTVSQQVQGSSIHFQTVGQYFLGLTPSARFL